MNSTRVFFVIVPSRFTVYSTFCFFLYRMSYGSIKESVHSKAILSTKKWLFNYSFSASQIIINLILSDLFPSVYYSSDNKTSFCSASINNSYVFLNSFNKTLWWILIQNINASKNKKEKNQKDNKQVQHCSMKIIPFINVFAGNWIDIAVLLAFVEQWAVSTRTLTQNIVIIHWLSQFPFDQVLSSHGWLPSTYIIVVIHNLLQNVLIR